MRARTNACGQSLSAAAYINVFRAPGRPSRANEASHAAADLQLDARTGCNGVRIVRGDGLSSPTRSIVGKAQPTAVVNFRFKDMSDLTLFFGGIELRLMEDPK